MTFEDDKLNRKQYADFLTEIVTNSENYKRKGDSDSMSIAIDSGWGTGKTTFLDMWENELNKEKFSIIRYNAWQNDFADDAFQSLAYCISNSEIFDRKNEIGKIKEKSKKFVKACGNIIKKSVKTIGNQIVPGIGTILETGCDVLEAGKVGITEIRQKEYDEFIKEYAEYYESINDIKSILNEASENKKIIIIIDELDRCKPLFAIKLLESIKHIFDAKNIVFVFALDMEQLGYSIKCIYGQDMDASGYLCRFFDYISKMPSPDIDRYLSFLMEKNPLKNNNLISLKRGKEESINIKNIFCESMKIFNLSLRDINIIYFNFLIFEELELKETSRYEAYTLYMELLCLKYKNSFLFNKLFIYQNIEKEDYIKITKYHISNEHPNFSYMLENYKKKIRDIQFVLSGKNIHEIQASKIINTENNIIKFKMPNDPRVHECDVNQYISVSNALFYRDLQKFNEIKEENLLEYIQRKMEFFNFKPSSENNAK